MSLNAPMRTEVRGNIMLYGCTGTKEFEPPPQWTREDDDIIRASDAPILERFDEKGNAMFVSDVCQLWN